MDEEQKNKKIQEALGKISTILEGVRELYPDAVKTSPIKITTPNSLRTLKRIDGIIKGFNEGNAERKLNSVMAFLKIISNKK